MEVPRSARSSGEAIKQFGEVTHSMDVGAKLCGEATAF